MNKRHLIHAAVLAVLNASRQAALKPVGDVFAGIKDDSLSDAAKPAVTALRSTVNGLVGVQLTELAGDAQAQVNAALDEVVAAEVAAQLDGKVKETLNGRIAAGELIEKAAHETAVNAAVEAARKQGREEALADVARTNERRAKCTANGLTPADADLAGEDAAFNARLELAKTRQAELAKFTLNGKALGAHLNVFADEAAWNVGLGSVKAAFEGAQAALGKIPDHAGGGSGAGGNDEPKFG